MTDLFGGDFGWNSPAVATVSPDAATKPATPETAVFCGVEAQTDPHVANVASVAAWKLGVERLSAGRRPANFNPRAWNILVSDARLLLQNWGADFVKLGWTTLEVFGVNRDPRARRLDIPGLLPVLHGRPVEAIDADTALIRANIRDTLTYQRKLVFPGGVPVWDWVGEARQ
jgi:hypothetical protein